MASFGPGSQHHEHQLGRLRRHLAQEASIMSISWEGCGVIWPGKPAWKCPKPELALSQKPLSPKAPCNPTPTSDLFPAGARHLHRARPRLHATSENGGVDSCSVKQREVVQSRSGLLVLRLGHSCWSKVYQDPLTYVFPKCSYGKVPGSCSGELSGYA